jgi:hypothetical protein
MSPAVAVLSAQKWRILSDSGPTQIADRTIEKSEKTGKQYLRNK